MLKREATRVTMNLMGMMLVCCIGLYACSESNAPATGSNAKTAEADDVAAVTQSGVVIKEAFMKALPPGQHMAAVYLTIVNGTDETQSVAYMHSPKTEAIEAHRVIYEDGIMRMRPVKHLKINAGQNLVLSPKGFHLMLSGLDAGLSVGDSFPVTFEFHSGEVVTANVEIRPRS